MGAKAVARAVLPPRARAFARGSMPVAVQSALSLSGAARRVGVKRRSYSYSWRAAARTIHLELLPARLFAHPGILVDIGAHVGAWTHAALVVAPDRTVVAIEPSPDNSALLSSRFAADPRVLIHQCAITSTDDVSVGFHTYSSSDFNSIRPLAPEIRDCYPDVTEMAIVDVPASTLDHLLRDDAIVLLKLDVQGGELEVLRGATESLARCLAVLIELNFVSHYDGDALFTELHFELKRRGFELHALAPGFHDAGGRLLWTDAVYLRS